MKLSHCIINNNSKCKINCGRTRKKKSYISTDVQEMDITDAKATMIYISTDYVFDGTLKDGEYSPEYTSNPQNEYGRTKLLGEQAIKETLENYYIIRTSWVFGQYGPNFVFTMQKLVETRDTITVVDDQFGRTTWTRILAEFMDFIIENKVPFGVYHLSNDDSCSWYEFAKEILKDNENVTVLPVTSEEFPQKAKRPQYSVMNLSKAKEVGFEIPTWKEALEGMLESL